MEQMIWKKCTVAANSKGIENIGGILISLGVSGYEVSDSRDFEELLSNREIYWDYADETIWKNQETSISFYIPDNEQGKILESAFLAALDKLKGEDCGALSVSWAEIHEEDWANSWKQYFKPFNVGKRLWVKPTWESESDAGTRKVLEIDPSSSFGTGQHNSTKLCMEFLDELISGGESVLDLGTGSGILSVAALLLGAKSAVGVDIDENAVRIACENAAQNGFKDVFSGVSGNLLEDLELVEKLGGEYDIVTANIVADVIISICPQFCRYLKKGGKLITSGIIDERAGEVIAALKDAGLSILESRAENGWTAVLAEN